MLTWSCCCDPLGALWPNLRLVKIHQQGIQVQGVRQYVISAQSSRVSTEGQESSSQFLVAYREQLKSIAGEELHLMLEPLMLIVSSCCAGLPLTKSLTFFRCVFMAMSTPAGEQLSGPDRGNTTTAPLSKSCTHILKDLGTLATQ